MTSTKTAKIEDQIVLPSDNIGPNNNLKAINMINGSTKPPKIIIFF